MIFDPFNPSSPPNLLFVDVIHIQTQPGTKSGNCVTHLSSRPTSGWEPGELSRRYVLLACSILTSSFSSSSFFSSHSSLSLVPPLPVRSFLHSDFLSPSSSRSWAPPSLSRDQPPTTETSPVRLTDLIAKSGASVRPSRLCHLARRKSLFRHHSLVLSLSTSFKVHRPPLHGIQLPYLVLAGPGPPLSLSPDGAPGFNLHLQSSLLSSLVRSYRPPILSHRSPLCLIPSVSRRHIQPGHQSGLESWSFSIPHIPAVE